METTRAGIAIYKINYQSDFILTVVCDVEWGTPFCIKFWTGEPAQAYYVGWDGNEYRNCKVVESDPSKLLVLFDDHHLPVGELKMQIAYHTTIEDFPNAIVDEVTNSMKVMAYIDGKNQKVALDFEGEEDAELQFELPAYANEAQRIANEEQRIANEQARIEAEQQRIDNEQTRQNNEAQRIAQESARVNEYAGLKADAVAATDAANDAATLANQKAQLAADKAALADAAATLANQKAQLAADKAALADAAATLANQKAEYADAQGDYAKEQGDYAKEQGDYAKEQGDTALADHRRAESDHETAASDHTIAANDHTQAGNDHTRAESDHSTAADDHTLAASDHSTAAADHTLAASDHSTAAAGHTLAASDHSTAANDHTQAGNDHTRAESDHTRAESDHAAVEVYVDSLGAFDISSYHATGGVLAKYADLTAALGTNGVNIPEAIRKGGMSVKFVHSSDNKYVQYRYMETDATTAATFTNADNWQSMNVDDEPTAGSKNLVKSDGVYEAVVNTIKDTRPDLTDRFSVVDPDGNIGFEIDKDGNLRSPTIEDLKSQIPDNIDKRYNDNLIVADNNGNIAFVIDKNGNILNKSIDDCGKNPFRTKSLYTIGDSLFCSNIWQETCAKALGCLYDANVNTNPEYPTSVGGTNSYMKYMLSTYMRVLNLVKQDVIPNQGKDAIIILGNSNDNIFDFDTNARAYKCDDIIELQELTTENLASVDVSERSLNVAIKLPQVSIGTVLTITQLPAREGDINLNVGWSADGHYDYKIHVVPQATQEETLAYVMERILEYDYGSTFDVKMSDNSVGFTMGGAFYPAVIFTDIGNTGMQVTTSESDNVTYYMLKWFNSDDISEWTNTEKWKDGNASSGWKSSIEELQRHYPLAHIAILNCPKIVIDMTESEMVRANGTYNQEAFADAILPVIEGVTQRNKDIADFYQVKFIDIWSELGVSANNVLSFYPASGNVHTNKQGQQRWGELIAGAIKGWIL